VSDRDAFRANRDVAKAKLHEKRLERAVRKQVAEEIAQAIDDARRTKAEDEPISERGDALLDAFIAGLVHSSLIAREIGSRDPA
jgi:hypothetical protein